MKNNILRQLAVIVTTIFTLIMNGAANAIPLNGRPTGEISDSFNALFVPAGYVFSIWGVIYIGLLAYTIYHSLPKQRYNDIMQRTGWWVALSSIFNGAWIYFWHYGFYPLTMLVMLLLLATLIVIFQKGNIGRTTYGPVMTWVFGIPFAIYLGWITVATIANASAVLIDVGWNGWGIAPLIWTYLMLAAGVIVSWIMAATRSVVAYHLVLVWAFIGISVRWQGDQNLFIAGLVAAFLVVIAIIWTLTRRKKLLPTR